MTRLGGGGGGVVESRSLPRRSFSKRGVLFLHLLRCEMKEGLMMNHMILTQTDTELRNSPPLPPPPRWVWTCCSDL